MRTVISKQNHIVHVGSQRPPAISGFDSLWRDLSPSGRVYLQKIGRAIGEVAPRPGSLIYVTARKLSIRLNGLEPTVFSAIDASTHLQVAQAYHSMTVASAVLFIEFVAQSFPFKLSQIRTLAEKPFYDAVGDKSHRDFSALMGERGFFHSLITDPSRDALSAITANLVFEPLSETFLQRPTSQELQTELDRFLFYHNNSRHVPWLDGKTPIQKLKTFGGFSRVRSFSPYVEGGGKSTSTGAAPGTKVSNNQSAPLSNHLARTP